MKKIIIGISITLLIAFIVALIPVFVDNDNLNNEQKEIEDLYASITVATVASNSTTTQTTTSSHDTTTSPSITTTTSSSKSNQASGIPEAINIDKLKKTNKDAIGWIYIPNSPVNYPFVKSSGNEYLNKSIYGKKNTSGTIYCYETQKYSNDNMDKNIVLYGHNMSNGTMFSYVEKLRNNPSILNKLENRFIYVYTETSVYKYEIFSIYKANKNDDFHKIYFKDDEDFHNFCNGAIAKSNYKQFSKDISNYNNIVTLSTCTNGSNKDDRAILHAVLIEETKNIY